MDKQKKSVISLEAIFYLPTLSGINSEQIMVNYEVRNNTI